MAKIEVEGFGKLKVVGSLGYVADVGAYVKEVERPDGSTAKAVKRGQTWRLWGAADRTAPLREWAAREAARSQGHAGGHSGDDPLAGAGDT